MNEILLTNIQRFSIHDGPGIRTTVFLKGCSLCCPWCSNPENISASIQQYSKDGISGFYGEYYSVSDIVTECLKDRNFYDGEINDPLQWNITSSKDIERLPGGVTFSGGECLLQAFALFPVCESLHSHGIHIAIETSLFVPSQSVKLALDMIDFFYIDMKILNEIRCKEVINGNLKLYLDNLSTFFCWTDKKGNHKPVVIRVPVIGKYTSNVDNRIALKSLLYQYKDFVLKIELIKEHNLAESKYKSLGLTMDYHGVDDSLMEIYKNELIDLSIPIEICRI